MFDKFKDKLIKKLGGYTFQDVVMNSGKEKIVKSVKNYSTIQASMDFPVNFTEFNKDGVVPKEWIERMVRTSLSDYLIEHYHFEHQVQRSINNPEWTNLTLKMRVIEN